MKSATARPESGDPEISASILDAELVGVGDVQLHINLVPTHSQRRVCVSRTRDGSIPGAAAQDPGCGAN